MALNDRTAKAVQAWMVDGRLIEARYLQAGTVLDAESGPLLVVVVQGMAGGKRVDQGIAFDHAMQVALLGILAAAQEDDDG